MPERAGLASTVQLSIRTIQPDQSIPKFFAQQWWVLGKFLRKGYYFTVAGLAQSVERLTAEREVAGSIPGAGPLLRVLK